MRQRLLLTRFQKILLTLLAGLGIAAALSTMFSLDLEASVPNLLLWIWIGSVGLLAMSVTHKRRGVEGLIAMVTAALFIQILWSFFSWAGSLPRPQLHSGTFYAPNQYAGYVLLLAPMFLSTFLLKQKPAGKVGFGVLTTLAYCSIWLSGSRGGIGAATVGAMVAAFVIFRRVGRRSFFASLVVLALTCVIFLWGGFHLVRPMADEAAALEAQGGKGSVTSSVMQRITWGRGAIAIGLERPVAGAGLGTFGDKFYQIQNPDQQWSLYAHNHYLEAFAEGGFLLLAGVVALPLVVLIFGFVSLKDLPAQKYEGTDESRAWHIGALGGVAGGAVHLLIDHDWSFPSYSAAFVILAVILSSRAGELEVARYPARFAAFLASAGLLILFLLGFSSYLVNSGSWMSPLESARLAARLSPWSAEAHVSTADHLVALGSEGGFKLAKDELTKASRIDQLDPIILWKLAYVYDELGKEEMARRSYAAAIRTVPNAADAYQRAALFEISDGHPEKAIQILERGIRRLSDGRDEYLRELKRRLRHEAMPLYGVSTHVAN